MHNEGTDHVKGGCTLILFILFLFFRFQLFILYTIRALTTTRVVLLSYSNDYMVKLRTEDSTDMNEYWDNNIKIIIIYSNDDMIRLGAEDRPRSGRRFIVLP